jgi:hypothetical protein
MAKPMLKSGEGWEIPCQPFLNSSINFVMGVVTSRDQRIQNKATGGKSTICGLPRPESKPRAGHLAPDKRLRCSRRIANIDGNSPNIARGEQDGTLGRKGRGDVSGVAVIVCRG